MNKNQKQTTNGEIKSTKNQALTKFPNQQAKLMIPPMNTTIHH
jgi:hypothetical protein